MVQFDGYCNCETRKQGETPLGSRRIISMPDLGLLQRGGENANTYLTQCSVQEPYH